MKKLITTSLLLISSFGLLKAQSYADSSSIKLDFEEVTSDDFDKYTLQSLDKLKAGPIKTFKSLGLTVKDTCYEVCETHLLDEKTGEILWMPASFDQGILGMSFSPSGGFLMVCSSYDGPDYDNYYEYRAEVVIYKIGAKKGLKAIEHYGDYYSLDWSIADFVWIDENTFALKVYEGERRGDGIEGDYKYLKAVIE